MSKRNKNIGCFPFILGFIAIAFLSLLIEENSGLNYDTSFLISTGMIAFLGITIMVINTKSKDNNSKNFDENEDNDDEVFPERYLYKEPEYSNNFLKERLLANAYVEEEDTNFNLSDFLPLKKEKLIIHIGFSKSSSVIYKEVLSQFKMLKTFSEDNSDVKSPQYQATFYENDLAEAIYFWDKIKNWKTSYIFISGEDVKENYSFLFCSRGRLNFDDRYCKGQDLRENEPDLLSLHLFRCREIGIYATEGMRAGCWYKFSHYDYENKKFIIDKERILQIIKEDLANVRLCPFINLHTIWQQFLHIPKEITLKNPHFAIVQKESGEVEIINRWDIYRNRYLNYKYLKAKYGKNLLSKV